VLGRCAIKSKDEEGRVLEVHPSLGEKEGHKPTTREKRWGSAYWAGLEREREKEMEEKHPV